MVPALLKADIEAIVGGDRILVSEVMGALRGGWRSNLSNPSGRRWRLGKEYLFRALLEEAGFQVRSREHAAGLAFYVAKEPFTTIVDGRGKTQEVR